MYAVTVQIDDDVLREVAQTATESPRRMRREAGIVARGPASQRIIVRLGTDPGPVRYTRTSATGAPMLNWKSEKQRKAFFATNGFGGGIPYIRKGKQSQGWRSVLNNLTGDGGGFISIENSVRSTVFVQGWWQQPYHSDTGWVTVDVAVREEQGNMQDELINGWWRATKAKTA